LQDVGDKVGFSKQRVRVGRMVVARTCLKRQLEVLAEWVKVVENSSTFVGAHFGMSFDTATNEITVPSIQNDECMENLISVSMHTLVSSRMLVLVFTDKALVEIMMVSPTPPFIDTTADSLKHGLHQHPLIKEINDYSKRILRVRPDSSTWTFGIDGAISNIRLWADEENNNNQACEYTLCQNHRNALNEGLVRKMMGKDVIKLFQATCSFVRMGHMFIKMSCSVLNVLQGCVRLVVGNLDPFHEPR